MEGLAAQQWETPLGGQGLPRPLPSRSRAGIPGSDWAVPGRERGLTNQRVSGAAPGGGVSTAWCRGAGGLSWAIPARTQQAGWCARRGSVPGRPAGHGDCHSAKR